MESSKKDKKFYQKLKSKYRLVIMREETFEERLSFRLSRLNVFVVVGTLVILLTIGIIFLIAFTPLKEYIPGYSDVELKRQARELVIKTDSLEASLNQKEKYIQNIKTILTGRDSLAPLPKKPEQVKVYDTIDLKRSKEDSLLREEIERATQYNLNLYYKDKKGQSLSSFSFFAPVKGLVTNKFNIAEKHYGVDIVAPKNEMIKATLDGTVIFSSWTLETGYILAIQHTSNIISVYKHNSVLLKKQGDVVKAGSPIAIIGETGEFSTGPHLHFELWHNGRPIDPKDYIVF